MAQSNARSGVPNVEINQKPGLVLINTLQGEIAAHSIKQEPGLTQLGPDIIGMGDTPDTIKTENSLEDLSDEEPEEAEFQSQYDEVFNGMGEEYDPTTELLPDVPAYRPSFRKVESLCEKLFSEAAAVFAASNYSDKCTQKLQQSILEKQKIQYPEPKRVALFGASGAGKSSLINSLLDTPELSASRGNGKACTCVITEYAHAPDDQMEPFVAEIQLFEIRQIKAMLKESYSSYHNYYVKPPDDIDQEEREALEPLASTALTDFRAMFGDRDEFGDDDAAMNFLRSGESASNVDILATLSEWVTEIIQRRDSGDGAIRVSATTAEDLQEKLEPYVMQSDSSGGDGMPTSSLWPLVRLVRVTLRSDLLSRGLVITDLPGLGDTNRTRTKATMGYIHSCAFVIVVARISRVLTDEATEQNLKIALKKPGKNKLLICTMIDEMKAAKAKHITTDAVVAGKHDRLYAIFESKKREAQDLRRSSKNMKGRERRDAEQILSSQEQRVRIYESLVVKSLVKLNNTKIASELRRKYANATMGIHFVSTRDYDVHLDGYGESMIPLPLEITGIPLLRYSLCSIPANEKMQVLRHYYRGILHGQLASMRIWCSQTSTDRKDEIREHIENPAKKLKEEIENYTQQLKAATEAYLLRPMEEASAEWTEHGLDLVTSWGLMNHASFGAWCRRYGAHKTKKLRFRNWNEDLAELVTGTFEKVWLRFVNEHQRCKDGFLGRLELLLDGIRVDLKGVPGVALLHMTPFLQSLLPKKEDLRRHVVVAFTAIEKASINAQEIATSGEHDGLIMEGMIPIYEKIINISKNSFVRRKTLLQDAMERGDPFAKICPRLKEILECSIDSQHKKLELALQKIFDDILEDFDRNFVVVEKPDKKRDAMKKTVLEFVDCAEKQLTGPIEMEYAKAVKG